MLRAPKGHGAGHWECLVKSAMFLVQYPADRIRLVLMSHTASMLPFLTLGIKRIKLLYLQEAIHLPERDNFTFLKKIWVHIFLMHYFSLRGTRAGPQAHTHMATEQVGCPPSSKALRNFITDCLVNSHFRTRGSRNQRSIFPFGSMEM